MFFVNRLIAKAKWLFGVVVAASRGYDASTKRELLRLVNTAIDSTQDSLYQEFYSKDSASINRKLRIEQYKGRLTNGLIRQNHLGTKYSLDGTSERVFDYNPSLTLPFMAYKE